MLISIESSADSSMITRLLSENKHLICDYYINEIIKDDFIYHESNNYIADGIKFVKYIFSNNKLIGAYSLESLNWDSQIFERSIWNMKLVLNERVKENLNNFRLYFIEDCKKNNIHYITCQVKTRDYNSTCFLENLGFKLTDSIIRFGIKLSNIKEFSDDLTSQITVREYENKDYNGYLNIVRQAFHNYPNRFRNDDSFSDEQCDRFYIEWAKNSVNGFADLVIVAEEDNNILGFSTVKYKRPYHNNLIIAEGQLSGVSNLARGKCVNTMMMKKRLKITSAVADYYEVGTQVYNYASQRSFYGCGLKPFSSYFSFSLLLD